jgi:hypothetical protein
MKRLTVTFLLLLAIVVLAALASVFFFKFKEYQMTQAVKKNAVVIDQEFHEWNLVSMDHADDSVLMTLYVRNTGPISITGNLIFVATLNKLGLEESFIRGVMRVVREDKLNNPQTARGRAIKAYLDRGKRLEQGREFEPVLYVGSVPPPYSFTFRASVDIEPGEVAKLTRSEQIPPNQSGYLLRLSVAGIEF